MGTVELQPSSREELSCTRRAKSAIEMFGPIVWAFALIGAAVADKGGFIQVQPSYGAPPQQSYGPPPKASYGPPPQRCYPKEIWRTMTKDVQGTSMYYETKTNEVPTTIYAYITETKILTETKVLYDTKMVTVPVYMTESKYGYNTASIYFTETKGVYVTKTITQSYPMTNYVTKTGYETN